MGGHGSPGRETGGGWCAVLFLGLISAPLAAIAMEAREGGNAEERSHAEHDSAGPQGHRPPTGQVTVEEDTK